MGAITAVEGVLQSIRRVVTRAMLVSKEFVVMRAAICDGTLVMAVIRAVVFIMGTVEMR